METKFCKYCGFDRPLDQFYKRKDSVDGYNHNCKVCLASYWKENSKTDKRKEQSRQHNRKSRRANKSRLVEYFGGKCVCCGYKRSLAGLQFHHLDPSQKDFTISSQSKRNYEELLEEAKKCIMVCANCHAEIHAGVRDISNGYKEKKWKLMNVLAKAAKKDVNLFN